MTDMEILQLFLDAQEWQLFECKRAAIQPAKLLETVVAFANTDGGFLVVGLEDPIKAQGEKRLIGISENLSNDLDFLKLIEKKIDPPLVLWNKFEKGIKVAGLSFPWNKTSQNNGLKLFNNLNEVLDFIL